MELVDEDAAGHIFLLRGGGYRRRPFMLRRERCRYEALGKHDEGKKKNRDKGDDIGMRSLSSVPSTTG